MGIYIKRTAIPDMDELPKTCAHCSLFGYDPWFEWNDNGRPELGAHRCNITGKLIDNTKREAHCPLRESHTKRKKRNEKKTEKHTKSILVMDTIGYLMRFLLS